MHSKKQLLCALLLEFLALFSFAQQDTLYQLEEVVVSGFNAGQSQASSVTIAVVKPNQLQVSAANNVGDMLTATPGVSLFSSTNAISKPSVRGLYGNRVLVLYNGLKLDNQQWQDEHGLGLSNFGIDRLELIKGPLAALYGTEAMGGVVHIIDEKKAITNARETEFSQKFQSNTGMLFSQLALKKSLENCWFGLRIGFESAADYADGTQNRILNSRNNGLYA